MVVAMALFATADMVIKLAAGLMSSAHTMFFLLGGGGIIFAALAKAQGEVFRDRVAFTPILLVRYTCELLAMVGMVQALASTPLSTVGAILQAVPLMVTVGAVMFLNETVRWQQWAAIAAGFIGMLFVVQPSADGFDLNVLWSVLAMVCLAGRDLTTRLTPDGLRSSRLAAYTMAAAMPFAIAWCYLSEGQLIPADTPWLHVIAMSTFGAVGYLALIASIRSTEVSVVSPFRYSRLLFLLAFGVVVFGERPNAWVLFGAGLIVGAGIYSMRIRR
jgi:drug/metabolite transporter (DMT)-like permease